LGFVVGFVGCPILAVFARVGIFALESSVIMPDVRHFWNLNPHPLKISKGGVPGSFHMGLGVPPNYGYVVYSPIEY
jgi:hypothetical protein